MSEQNNKAIYDDVIIKEMYQNVVITLSDGTTHVFTGKACIQNEKDSRRISDIQFTKPKPMPEGYSFGLIPE